MLYANLFFAVILLIAANVIILIRGKVLVGTTIALAVIFSLLPFALIAIGAGLLLYVLWEFAFALTIVARMAAQTSRPRTRFVAGSLIALIFVFGINLAIAWSSKSAEINRFREHFPYQSFEGRLPARPAIEQIPPKQVEMSVAQLEEYMTHFGVQYGESFQASEKYPGGWGGSRTLYHLHEETIGHFINQPNFGWARLIPEPSEAIVAGSQRKEKPPGQPGTRSNSKATWNEIGKELTFPEKMDSMHADACIDFINPRLNWLFKDIHHVAGFQSHGLSKVPEPGDRFKLQTVDLVGLVVHPKPVAYVSDKLPAMDELREAPLRDLNAFESAGLKALQDGNEIFVREMPDRSLRMLGAIRALKQCVDCHGGSRGDLLGAFSYELRRE
jgi:hypothetical protein